MYITAPNVSRKITNNAKIQMGFMESIGRSFQNTFLKLEIVGYLPDNGHILGLYDTLSKNYYLIYLTLH